MFYNNATLSLSLSFSTQKVVPGGNWLTPVGKFVAGLTPLGARMSASPSLVQPQ